jgi:hypothetical protein
VTFFSRSNGKRTLGPVSDEVISISFILAPAPLEGTESALNYSSALINAFRVV